MDPALCKPASPNGYGRTGSPVCNAREYVCMGVREFVRALVCVHVHSFDSFLLHKVNLFYYQVLKSLV